MVDFVGSVDQPGLMYLPWDIPLERWPDEAIVALPRGISRHVVRFSRIGNRVFAIKEIDRGLAEHEYALLRMLGKRGIPAVAPVGVVLDRTDDRGEPLDACLITEHLSYSLPYRAVFSGMLRADTVNRLTDALALLIVRLQ